MVVKYFWLSVILVTVFSCRRSDVTLLEFDPFLFEEREVALSSLADDISYISLDDSIQLGMIYDFHFPKFVNNSVYLYENKLGILVFSRNGVFLRKIGSIGRGPGEYLHGLTFAVDEKTESIYINDSRDLIKVFSKTGNYLRDISVRQYGGSIDAIEIVNSMLFISFQPQFSESGYDWIVLDTIGNLKKAKARSIPIFQSNWLAGGGTYIFNNNLSYWHQYIDTVFTISPALDIKPTFILKQGEYRLPRSNFDFNNFVTQYITFNQIFETRLFFMVRYSFYNGKNGFVIIDKIHGKSYLTYWDNYNSGSLINDLDGGVNFFPQSYFVENGKEYLVKAVEPYLLINHIGSNEFKDSAPNYSQKKMELEKFANSLKDTDNPVLMVVRLKE